MVGSPASKRYLETSVAAGGSRPASPICSSSGGTKRRHSSAASPFRSLPPPLVPSPSEALFRILCPADLTGGVIGKGGAIVRQLREETGAKIRIQDAVPGSSDRVIVVVGDCQKKRSEGEGRASGSGSGGGATEEAASLAQLALLRVFERVLRADEERPEAGDGGRSGRAAVCRLLVPSSQVGCVLGKGGKIVEKIRHESGAQIKILGEEHAPACATLGDKLIQISGSSLAVKKALQSVSSCLQENPRVENTDSAIPKAFGAAAHVTGSHAQMDFYAQRIRLTNMQVTENQVRGYSTYPGTEYSVPANRKIPEEEVTFRMLCSNDKVGSIIGKGGLIIRSLQTETGATIRILDPVPGSEERVILISAREAPESRYSPAQDAVLRVHSRLAEFDNVSAVSARLLVPAQQIGCLLGKGGAIISEMRRATGASIQIFLKEQVPKCAQPKDEVVQVSGTAKSVHDGLVRITGRIRETIFPPKNFPGAGMTRHTSVTSERPDLLRSGHEVTLPGRFSGSDVSHRTDPSIGFYENSDKKHPISHNKNDNCGIEQVPFSYGGGSTKPTSVHDCPSPSGSKSLPPANVSEPLPPANDSKPLVSEIVNSVTPPDLSNMKTSVSDTNETMESRNQASSEIKTVEQYVPKQYLEFVYGEDKDNLADIRRMSGATVIIEDPKGPEDPLGIVRITGDEIQRRDAQCLVVGFVMCGVYEAGPYEKKGKKG